MSVYLDVGSTNSRAWRVEDGRILESAGAAVGVRDTVVTGSTELIRATARDLIARLSPDQSPELVIASGMITSSIGLAEVPHVPAPAGVEDLVAAAHLVLDSDVSSAPVVLVPGVRTLHEDVLHSDVMRGEEPLVLGLLSTGRIHPSDMVLNAGSHWKLVTTDEWGRIAGSVTSIGGEIIHAVKSATVVGASQPPESASEWQPEWLERGATAARRMGLLRAFFCVRLLDQAGNSDVSDRYAFLIGAGVAHDLESLRRTGKLDRSDRVFVTGSPALARAWTHLLVADGVNAVTVEPQAITEATVAGLAAIEAVWRRTHPLIVS
jgi:2-dehydro-3-deoxygalactonokinase